MNSYNKKCKGCGAYLNNNKDEVGYVPKFDEKTTKYCYRCFRLKNYNEYNINENISTNINKTIENLDFKNKHIMMIIDILDLEYSFIKLPSNVEDLTIVINKIDLLPKSSNYEKIKYLVKKNIDYFCSNYKDLIFVSSKSKTSMKSFYNKLEKISKHNKKKIIFIGKSNVGKSSIINALLKLNNLDDKLITNNSINTTVNLQQIKINRLTVIDTPGYLSQGNLLMYLKHDDISKIFSEKQIKPKVFQIPYTKDLLIENLISIKVEPNEKGSVIFYGTNLLKIQTFKTKTKQLLNQKSCIGYNVQDDKNLIIHQLSNDNSERFNISISGLGTLSFINIKSINILINKNVNISKIKFPYL